jgi:hypothetical protein
MEYPGERRLFRRSSMKSQEWRVSMDGNKEGNTPCGNASSSQSLKRDGILLLVGRTEWSWVNAGTVENLREISRVA